MRTYKISDLRKFAKENGYTMAGLENMNNERIVPMNQPGKKISIDKQLSTIETRLKSEVNPDGVYNVVMAANISRAKNPDRFPITKGKVQPEALAEAEKKQTMPVVIEKSNDVLSWDSALQMQQTIADLKAQVARLEFEKENLEAQLEDEDDGLNEDGKKLSDLAEMIKDTIPTLLPLADRLFNLQERKLDIEELKLTGAKSSYKSNGEASRVKIPLPGSKEHLTIIEFLANSEKPEDEDKLNKELDKLKAANTELYKKVLEELGFEEEEEQE